MADICDEIPPGSPLRPGETHSKRRRRRLAAARALGTHKPEEWWALKRVCGDRCARCGVEDRLEPDHIVNLCHGGSDAIGNIQPLCPRCNTCKTSHHDYRPADYLDRIHRLLHGI